MSNRAKYFIYLLGSFFLAMGIADLITGIIASDFSLINDKALSSTILIIIGLLVLAAGMILLKRYTKELAVFSILLVFVMITTLSIIKIFLEPDLWMEFLLATIVSVVLALIVHFISARVGTYDAINEINSGMK